MLPETLYKFVSFDTARKILGNMTVRYTPLPDLNDPAEAPVVDEAFNEIYQTGLKLISDIPEVPEHMRESITLMFTFGHQFATNAAVFRKCGILCLADPKSTSSHLMWSHYAENHKGAAIGFRPHTKHLIGAAGLRKILYRPPEPFHRASSPLESVFRKHSCWEYENEYRSWKLLEPGIPQAQFEHFGPTDIKEIILGCRSTSELTDYVADWKDRHNANELDLKRCLLLPDGSIDTRTVSISALKMMHRTIEAYGPSFQAEIDQADQKRMGE